MIMAASKTNQEKNEVKPGVLYLVSTPIGNLSDISDRALKVLSSVNFIAAEDTRNSGKLLSYFGISKPIISYFEHNKREHGEIIISKLKDNQSCALITDAGTPAISDPGEDIVKACIENSIPVTLVAGTCAIINALVLSGSDTKRFCFEGFLSAQKNERIKRLNEINDETRTIVFYEAPHKLKRTLHDMFEVFGDRKISLCRELTKLNEEIIRTTLKDASGLYDETEPRGEFVLVLEGAEQKAENDFDNLSIEDHFNKYILSGMKKMDAIKQVAKDRNVPKNDIYKVINTKEN